MELLYIWIHDFRNIRNQGFNFSPNWKFSYDENSDLLSVSKGEGLPKNFWQAKNIANITGIIGENGAGKTSLMFFLLNIIFGQAYRTKRHPKSGLYLIDDPYFQTIGFNYPVKCFFIFRKEANINYLEWDKSKIFSDEKVEWEDNSIKKDFDEILMSYYSSVLSVTTPYMITEYGNLSTTKSLANSLLEDGNNLNLLERYTYNDFSLQINYLRNPEYAKLLPFSVENLNRFNLVIFPDLIEIINYDKKGFFEKYKTKDIDTQSAINFLKRLADYIKNKGFEYSKSYFPFCLMAYSITNILDHITSENSFNFNDADLYSRPIDFNYGNLCLSYLKSIFYPQSEIFTRVFDTFTHHAFLTGYTKYYRSDNDIHSDISKMLILFEDYDIIYSAIKDLQNLIIDKINNLNNTSGQRYALKTFAFPEWVGLSSGETLLLQIYSRYFDLSTQNTAPFHLAIIDEGEIGLHPQWQKSYTKDIIHFLSKTFKDKELQIILTSHSPFIVSDLPKQNVIFLEKDKDTGYTKVVDGVNKSATFGANIHTLFADAFFMEGGLIGEFAKEKINGIIQILRPIVLYHHHSNREVKVVGDWLEVLQTAKISESKINALLERIASQAQAKSDETRKKLIKSGISEDQITSTIENWLLIKKHLNKRPEMEAYFAAKQRFLAEKSDISKIINMVGDMTVKDKLDEMYVMATQYIENRSTRELEIELLKEKAKMLGLKVIEDEN